MSKIEIDNLLDNFFKGKTKCFLINPFCPDGRTGFNHFRDDTFECSCGEELTCSEMMSKLYHGMYIINNKNLDIYQDIRANNCEMTVWPDCEIRKPKSCFTADEEFMVFKYKDYIQISLKTKTIVKLYFDYVQKQFEKINSELERLKKVK